MNRSYFRLIRNLTNAATAWHIQQSAAIGLMPLVSSLLAGDLRGMMSDEDEKEMKGISIEGQKLLNRYASLSGEPFVSERDTWLYDYFPVKMGDVLMMPIIGPISQEDYCGTAGTNTIAGWYEKAASDNSIKAIIENKNTPGGEVFGTRMLTDLKNRIRTSTGKLIIGATQGMECSAGLYIGASDDYKFALSEDCLIGSCGVMTTFQDWSKWYAEKGLTIVDLYSKDSPLKNDAYRKAMKGDFKGYTDGILFKFDSSFMGFMKQSRPNISPDALKGAEFLSSDAIDAGLIDQIAPFSEVYDFTLEAIKSPSILTKTNTKMTQKTLKVSAFFAAIKDFVGVKLVNDDGTELVATSEDDSKNEEKSDSSSSDDTSNQDDQTEKPEATTTVKPEAAAPTEVTANSEVEKWKAEAQKNKEEAEKWKAQAQKGKATTVQQKQTDTTALTTTDVSAQLTHFEG